MVFGMLAVSASVSMYRSYTAAVAIVLISAVMLVAVAAVAVAGIGSVTV
jgi:hypothetical protein